MKSLQVWFEDGSSRVYENVSDYQVSKRYGIAYLLHDIVENEEVFIKCSKINLDDTIARQWTERD